MKTPSCKAHVAHNAARIKPGKNPVRFFHKLTTAAIFLLLISSDFESAATAFNSNPFSDSSGVRELRYAGSFGLFGQVAGPEIVGGYVNIFLLPGFSLNAGAGIVAAYHFGANVYLARNPRSAKFCPYIGFQRVSVLQINFLSDDFNRQAGWYLPVGVEYITKKRFSLQLEMGPNLLKKDYGQSNTDPFIVTFRIGGYFYTKKK